MIAAAVFEHFGHTHRPFRGGAEHNCFSPVLGKTLGKTGPSRAVQKPLWLAALAAYERAIDTLASDADRVDALERFLELDGLL